MMSHKAKQRFWMVVLPSITMSLIVLIWHMAVVASGTKVFPSPGAVLFGTAEFLSGNRLFEYLGDSLFRVLVGYSVAVMLGVPLGLAMGWYAWLGDALNGPLQALRPISPLAWIPIAIVIFGISNLAPIFLVFLASFFPIVLAAMAATRRVPRAFKWAAQNFGLSGWQMLFRVILPAAFPRVLGGLRIAFGVAWLVLVAAEMIAVDSGLGYMIIDARNAGQRYDLVIGGMLIIGLTGLAADFLIARLERIRAIAWGFTRNN